MSAEEGQLIGRATTLIDGDDGKGASSAGLPIDRDVFRVRLCSVSAGDSRSRARLS